MPRLSPAPIPETQIDSPCWPCDNNYARPSRYRNIDRPFVPTTGTSTNLPLDIPTFKPATEPCKFNCGPIPEPAPIDLFANLQGPSNGELLTQIFHLNAEQMKTLDDSIEELVLQRIKGLPYKPLDAAFASQKKEIQEAVGAYGFAAAVKLCGGGESFLFCGAIGFGIGWYMSGKAFDKIIETPFEYITSPQTPAKSNDPPTLPLS
jgi:hypothetical protein